MSDTARIETLPVERLGANDWNPNQMDDDGFAELVAEIRHLGRLPKPIVVRANGNGYGIVDGEHGWRAAQEAGLAEVACEVIDADDFESMRQTYKRNQHGTHDPVRLGRMFRRMRDERGLSNRALADQIEVSEGTIRNALAYAEAAELRNRYAAAEHAQDGTEGSADEGARGVAKLTVKQVRHYISLPVPIGDAWVDAGARDELLTSALEVEVHRPGRPGVKPAPFSEECDWFAEIVHAGLGDLYAHGGFVDATRRALELLAWRYDLRPHLGDDTDAYLAPVVDVLKRYRISPDRVLTYLPLREAGSNAYGRRLQCDVTPERWAQILREAVDEEGSLVWARLRAGVGLALAELGVADGADDALDRDPQTRLVLFDAPDWVRDAPIGTRDKLTLARAEWSDVPDDERDELVRNMLPTLELKHRLLKEGYGYVTKDGRGVGPLQGGIPLWNLTAEKLINGYFAEKRAHAERERRTSMYGDREGLVEAAAKQLAPSLRQQSREKTKDGRESLLVLVEQLNELPWSVLALIACLVTGEGDPGEVWLRAVDGRDPTTKGKQRGSLESKRRLEEMVAEFKSIEARLSG